MDKNRAKGAHEWALAGGLCLVACSDPFLKAAFVLRLAEKADLPAVYIDFDLMYSGYAASNMAKLENASVYRPEGDGLFGSLGRALAEAASKKCVIIADSVNGLVSLCGRRDAGRIADSYLMMLAMAARSSGSAAVATCMAAPRDGSWALRPTSRKILAARAASKVHLRQSGDQNIAVLYDKNDALIATKTL